MLPSGAQRNGLGHIAVGSLLRHKRIERQLDGALGAPAIRDARILVELHLKMRKAAASSDRGAEAAQLSSQRARAGGGEAAAGRKRKAGA